MRTRSWLPAGLCLLLVLLFTGQLVLHALSTSATTDEPLHLLAGHRYLACGDFAFNPEHPPLLKAMAAVPLQAMDVRMPEGLSCAPGFIPKAEAFRLGAEFMQTNGQDRILVPARLMAMLPAIALALLVWALAWRMFGGWCAVGTMALLAMEPVLVAHGSLVTTDMVITTTTLLVVAVMHASCAWLPWRRVLALGCAFGLMLASKHSALLLLPVLVALRVLDAGLFRTGPWRAGEHLVRPLAELAAAGGIALAILWASYGFRYSATPGADHTVDLGAFLASVGKPGAQDLLLAKALRWVQATRLFPEAYLMGLTDIVGTSVRNTRVLGRFYQEGQWFFYPIAFVVKSSVALLLLLPVGVAALALDRGRRRELLFLLLVPCAYFAIAMSSKFTDGIRHVLLVYPFCLLLAGYGLVVLWRRRGAWPVVLAGLLGYQAVVVARTAPDYIPFANAFWGGPAHAYDALTFDSVEWGQSLKRIRGYIDRHEVRECWVAGVGDPLLFAQVHPCKRLPEGRFWRGRRGGVEPLPRKVEGTLFLGVRMASPREGDTWRDLLGQPGEMLAGAVFVRSGRFDLPRVAALSHAMFADELVGQGKTDEAVRQGEAAIALAADDPRAWISYGDALLAAGRDVEARAAEAEATRALARKPALEFFSAERLASLRERLGRQK